MQSFSNIAYLHISIIVCSCRPTCICECIDYSLLLYNFESNINKRICCAIMLFHLFPTVRPNVRIFYCNNDRIVNINILLHYIIYRFCSCFLRGLLKFESRVSSIENGRIRCFLLIQLKLETRVLILETRYSIEHNTRFLQYLFLQV